MSATSAPGKTVHRTLITGNPPTGAHTVADAPPSTSQAKPRAATTADGPHGGADEAPANRTTADSASVESAVPGRSCPQCGQESPVVVTSSVSAEAQQGDGPAAASSSGSAVGESAATNTVSVVVGPQGAAAASPFGVVVTGPYGTAAASQIGVTSVGPHGAAAACNAANGSRVTNDVSPTATGSAADGQPARVS